MATLPHLPHLQMVNREVVQDYKSRRGRGKQFNFPPRDRAMHGSAIRTQLESFIPISADLHRQRIERHFAHDVPDGICIEFQSAVGFDLAFPSLDLPSKGIELLNVRVVDDVTYATCYVPDGRLDVLIAKVTQYIEAKTQLGNPRFQPLVESIQSIGLATLEAYWTDEVPPPLDNEMRWWEVWLRRDGLSAQAAFLRFSVSAQTLHVTVAQSWLEFPDRIVCLVEATRTQLAQASSLLNLIAEIRRSDLRPTLSDAPTIEEQDTFVAALAEQIEPPADDAVAVTLLDTGVNRGHPLIAPFLAHGDVLTVVQSWGANDHHGHGTQMAGIALYGDLRKLQGGGAVSVAHRLESVKSLAPAGGAQTPPELFGAVTRQAIELAEANAPGRRRIFCKTVTSPMHQSGLPSSYSASVDAIAFGRTPTGPKPRLVVIAAGNVPDTLWQHWPQSNQSFGVEQPGQSWNALTVGSMTNMVALPGSPDWAGWTAAAPAGELGVFSATSMSWRNWPVKPEVVFEGGNAALDAERQQTNLPKTMQLLTTHRDPHGHPLSHTSMTSPAASQAARLAANVATQYPDFWPETLKGLIVHHAEWTPQQIARFCSDDSPGARQDLLRAVGWGVPNEQSCVSSARNHVCLVAQERIQPYRQEKSKGKMKELKIFALPWPKAVLADLHDTEVTLKVTLCYFIEPSPSKRGWLNRYRYASHGLRFDLRRLNESTEEFNKRVNAEMLEANEKIEGPEDEGWFLKHRLRTIGSTHSDQWTGPAVNLLSRDLIAVYPVVGWWRENVDRGHCSEQARFSLILSLKVQSEAINLYAPIQAELAIPLSAQLLNELGG